MIFEGVNGISTADDTTANQTDTYNRLISTYKQIATRIHGPIFPCSAATNTPFSPPNNNVTLQSYTSPIREQTRQKVNDFIRNPGTFDAVFDFDSLLRNQSVLSQLVDALQSGDYLHPNERGCQLLADTFDLSVFDRFQGGVTGFI